MPESGDPNGLSLEIRSDRGGGGLKGAVPDSNVPLEYNTKSDNKYRDGMRLSPQNSDTITTHWTLHSINNRKLP